MEEQEVKEIYRRMGWYYNPPPKPLDLTRVTPMLILRVDGYRQLLQVAYPPRTQ
mgnify:CR=1 FL=1